MNTMAQPKRYVVGFALDDEGRVALIRKRRPEWQAGHLNGIGGHIEDSDASPLAAMQREFQEETGHRLSEGAWQLMLRMTFAGAEIFFYRTRVEAATLNLLQTTTDEEVVVVPLATVASVALSGGAVVANLAWLLPLAAYAADTYSPFVLQAGHAVSV